MYGCDAYFADRIFACATHTYIPIDRMIEILIHPAFFIEMQRTDNNQPSQFCTDASYHKILELSNFR